MIDLSSYRYGQKYRENGTEYRTLAKVYGLRFVVTISGKGGKFYIVNIIFAIGKQSLPSNRSLTFLCSGSGIGFLAIATLIAEFVLMNIHQFRDEFRKQKFEMVQKDGTILINPGTQVDSTVRMNPAVRMTTTDDGELLERQ